MRTLPSLVFVLLLAVMPASGSCLRTTRTDPQAVRAAGVERFLPFPAPAHYGISNLAFAPDGTAYFLNHTDEVDSVSPNGRYTKIIVAHARSASDAGNAGETSIVYAHGNLWMLADYGIVKAAPDGSRHRLYVLQAPGYPTLSEAITVGNDGAIYALAEYVIYTSRFSAPYDPARSYFIYRGLLDIGPDDDLRYPTISAANAELTSGLTVLSRT